MSDTPSLAIFDPFTAPFIFPRWHKRIKLVDPPPVSKVYNSPITGGKCCLWTGACNDDGYGYVRIKGRLWLLHRYSFCEFYKVQLLPSQHIDHLCRHRQCFNPYHHEDVSLQENTNRGNGVNTQFKPSAPATEQEAEDARGMIDPWSDL